MSSLEDNINCEHLTDLSHNQLIDLIDSNIRSLIRSDPLLNDLPNDITTHELEDIIGQEMGRSLKVFIEQQNNHMIGVIVDKEANVNHFKKAIERQLSMRFKRDKTKSKYNINWRYVWRTYYLIFDKQKLTNHLTKIKDYGICNNSKIGFIKKNSK